MNKQKLKAMVNEEHKGVSKTGVPFSDQDSKQIKNIKANIDRYDKKLVTYGDENHEPWLIEQATEYIKLHKITGEKAELEKAVKYYDRLIKINPDQASSYAKRAELHAKMGNVDLATKDIIKATEVNNKDGNILTSTFTNYVIKDVALIIEDQKGTAISDAIDSQAPDLVLAGMINLD